MAALRIGVFLSVSNKVLPKTEYVDSNSFQSMLYKALRMVSLSLLDTGQWIRK